ncbi:hypothetical protein G3N57_03180 [Paraburkholderia sp. Se-20369]|nr:hypothetical protein [Paraburkholderia sp. Se-20369]
MNKLMSSECGGGLLQDFLIQVADIDEIESADRMIAALLKSTCFMWNGNVGIFVGSIERVVCNLIDLYVDSALQKATRLAYRDGLNSGVRGEMRKVGDCGNPYSSDETTLLFKRVWVSGFSHGRMIRDWMDESSDLKPNSFVN